MAKLTTKITLSVPTDLYAALTAQRKMGALNLSSIFADAARKTLGMESEPGTTTPARWPFQPGDKITIYELDGSFLEGTLMYRSTTEVLIESCDASRARFLYPMTAISVMKMGWN